MKVDWHQLKSLQLIILSSPDLVPTKLTPRVLDHRRPKLFGGPTLSNVQHEPSSCWGTPMTPQMDHPHLRKEPWHFVQPQSRRRRHVWRPKKNGGRLKTGYLKLSQTLMMIACLTFSNSFKYMRIEYSRWNDSKRLSVGPHPAFPGKASLQKWRHIFFLSVRIWLCAPARFPSLWFLFMRVKYPRDPSCVSCANIRSVPFCFIEHQFSIPHAATCGKPSHRREGDTTDTTVLNANNP